MSIPPIRPQPQPQPMPPIPEPLITGWVVAYSKTHPGYVYYFHQDTGECRWDRPVDVSLDLDVKVDVDVDLNLVHGVLQELDHQDKKKRKSATTHTHTHTHTSATTTSGISKKRKESDRQDNGVASSGSKKRVTSAGVNSSDNESGPKSVRVLHILKKHVGSRRPSSWRRAKITDIEEKAIEDLKGLIEMLKEAEQSGELRETFEVLAKTESDCSSAKRGGDLKEFTRGKMQPEFEKAAFALEVGQMSNIVKTQSGVHVLLRIPNK